MLSIASTVAFAIKWFKPIFFMKTRFFLFALESQTEFENFGSQELNFLVVWDLFCQFVIIGLSMS